MNYPTTATASAVRSDDGCHRLVNCSLAGVKPFEEATEEIFCTRLIKTVLEREPAIKTLLITFENGDEVEYSITMAIEPE